MLSACRLYIGILTASRLATPNECDTLRHLATTEREPTRTTQGNENATTSHHATRNERQPNKPNTNTDGKQDNDGRRNICARCKAKSLYILYTISCFLSRGYQKFYIFYCLSHLHIKVHIHFVYQNSKTNKL